jgi:hypothetical protein
MTFGKLSSLSVVALVCVLHLSSCGSGSGSVDAGDDLTDGNDGNGSGDAGDGLADGKDGSGDDGSGSGDAGDGLTDGRDGSDDDGNGDGTGLPDEDLGDDFGLYIPPETWACALDPVAMMSSWDVDTRTAILNNKGRAMFHQGSFRLYRDRESFDVDLIDKMQIGADGAEAVREGPGTFTRTIRAAGDTETYTYAYEQNFRIGGEPFRFTLRFRFEIVSGVVAEPIRTLDEKELANLTFFIQGRLGSTNRTYSTCRYTHFDCSVQEFGFSDGATLKVEPCKFCPEGMICKAFLAGLKRAEIKLGGQMQYIDDYFHLAHAMRHHNWGCDYMVMFAEPIGSVFGLYLGSAPYPDENFVEANYLDADLATINTISVVRHENLPGW